MDEWTARQVLAGVRRAIEEFRDAHREGIVRARNHLLQTTFLSWILVYALLATAIAAGAGRDAILAGLSFFLAGGAVGVADRLRRGAEIDSAIDDFGLFEARLFQAPLLSGLAGLGAVVIVGLAPALAGVVGPHGGAVTTVLPSLADIFSLTQNPTGVLIALAAGLAPETFFGGLRAQAKLLRRGLEDTQASGGTGAGTAP
jgi:hypothetical protein